MKTGKRVLWEELLYYYNFVKWIEGSFEIRLSKSHVPVVTRLGECVSYIVEIQVFWGLAS